MNPESRETLADLGEWELIRRLGAFAPAGQFADDAAVLSLGGAADPAHGDPDLRYRGGNLVLNTDVLVEGIHFSDCTTAPGDVGWRSAAANLSDLAAMGCTQVVGITVGLVAPAGTPWRWVEEVYGGLCEALRAHGGVLLGGDCSAGGQRLLAITALGQLSEGNGPIRRGDAQPGDLLVSTGPHGLSRLGLALLLGELACEQHLSSGAEAVAATDGAPGRNREGAGNPGEGGRQPVAATQAERLEPALIQRAIGAHRRPVPRFDAVEALIRSRPANLSWRVGGCDSSDGLAAAATAIAAASGCAAKLDRRALPLDPAMAKMPQAEAWCLGGGEDFELVLALEPAWAQALVTALPGATVIGRLEAGQPGTLGWADGGPWPEDERAAGGFRHFG